MNTVLLTGHLGDAPKIGETRGVTFASFSLATSFTLTDKASGDRRTVTDWHRVVAFNGLAKSLGSLGKGDRIAVRGRLQSKMFKKNGETRTAVEVVAAEIEFLKLKAWAAAPSPEGEEPEPEIGDLLLALDETLGGEAVPGEESPF